MFQLVWNTPEKLRWTLHPHGATKHHSFSIKLSSPNILFSVFLVSKKRTYGTFPPDDAGRFSPQRCGTGPFPPPKSGRDPDWAVLRRLKGCRALPASLSYTRRPLIGWQNRHFCATGGQTNITRKVFLDNESFVYWRKCSTKVCRPSWTSYVVALCSFCTFFFLGSISRLHCRAAMRSQCLRSCTATTIRLKPRPTIRVLSAVETQAVTELGYTTPSLLHQSHTEPTRTHRWKRGIKYSWCTGLQSICYLSQLDTSSR